MNHSWEKEFGERQRETHIIGSDGWVTIRSGLHIPAAGPFNQSQSEILVQTVEK